MDVEEKSDPELVSQELQKERERFLERSYPVNRSPSFILQLKRKDERDFSLEDIKTAVMIRNALIGEGNNALDFIHNEGDGIHISGLALTREGLENLQEIIRELSGKEENSDLFNADLEFSVAMAVPEKEDIQYVTVAQDEDDFTIYGSGVLALARGSKVSTADVDEVPVYQLVHEKDEGRKIIEADKDTLVAEQKLDDVDIEWATEEQIEALPEDHFRKIDPDSIYLIELDMNDYMAVKADINDSGGKIKQIRLEKEDPVDLQQSIEDRQLIVAANYKLLSSVQEFMQLRSGDLQQRVFMANVLGDSRVFIFPRSEDEQTAYKRTFERTYEALMRDMAERGSPDFFQSVQGEKVVQDREKVLGELTSIELPLQGRVQLFMSEGKVIAMSKKWSSALESAMEKLHKDLRLKPSQILTKEMYEQKRVGSKEERNEEK